MCAPLKSACNCISVARSKRNSSCKSEKSAIVSSPFCATIPILKKNNNNKLYTGHSFSYDSKIKCVQINLKLFFLQI